MAEYWKSAPRFWCKQCKIFIRDTPFEKTQHEASPKHQGSLKRFLREIHKNNEIKQKETLRAKNEVERLRQAIGGGPAPSKPEGKSGKPEAAPAPGPAQRFVGAEERKKQMAQLAELGVAIPEEYRADMALAGEWQTLSETNVDSQEGLEGAAKSIGIRKRKHNGEEEEEGVSGNPSERLVSKGWGSRMKIYPGAEDDDEDLDALLASTKDLKKNKTPAPDSESNDRYSTEEHKPELPSALKEEESVISNTHETTDKARTKVEDTASTSQLDFKELADETPGPVFKKRKAKVMRK
ncbi:hypothetical protein N7462_007705 [Penicillium macrosclerotiorum]|uniref:uncharacterized protein n=1 Tax=Penicillium macrosclerotiorum TaxID=303699 RepID=UPI002548490E|nr:uncharacterized protein N7462_007705 [Penicillium macrosclerotiorum]KAJ5679461.1 hypothetical protein N7462_007705 [Penicillium macrosclerotiorum]